VRYEIEKMTGGVVEERAHETGRTDNFREESPQGENIEIVYVIEKKLYIATLLTKPVRQL